MDLNELTLSIICKELSEKTDKKIIGLITKSRTHVDLREYYIANNGILNLFKIPFVKIERENGNITITSLFKKYNSLIKELADKNKYNYKENKKRPFLILINKKLYNLS